MPLIRLQRNPYSNEIQVNDELIDEFIKSAIDIINTVMFCKKISSDTISEYNHLKLKFDNIKLHQNLTKIQSDDMITTGLRKFREVNEKTTSTVDEALIKNKKTIVQYIIAILLDSKLVDKKEQARLEMHYDFNHMDIMKEIESYFTI